jgi:chromosome segregation ATPase
MATNGKGERGPLGDMSPGTGGKRGGLVFALVISVLLLLVVAFLWASGLQETKSLRDQVDAKESTIKNLTAERDQSLREVSRLRTAPQEAEEELRKLNQEMKTLDDERRFAERQREEASEFLIECQRENIDLRTTVSELEAQLQALKEGGE